MGLPSLGGSEWTIPDLNLIKGTTVSHDLDLVGPGFTFAMEFALEQKTPGLLRLYLDGELFGSYDTGELDTGLIVGNWYGSGPFVGTGIRTLEVEYLLDLSGIIIIPPQGIPPDDFGVPEPGSWALIGAGMAALIARRYRGFRAS